MKFTRPTITDHGTIAEHTFYRCASGTGTPATAPPKDPNEYGHDKFGECSSGHAS